MQKLKQKLNNETAFETIKKFKRKESINYNVMSLQISCRLEIWQKGNINQFRIWYKLQEAFFKSKLDSMDVFTFNQEWECVMMDTGLAGLNSNVLY